MPLLDHHRPPLSRTHPWRAFHHAWASAIARLLNAGVLPPGYYALASLDRVGPIEIDVAALQTGATEGASGSAGALWSPGEPATAVAVEWPPADEARVDVMSDDGDPPLAAAIELVSPRNKDRAKAREAFAAKCADHLSRGVGVVVVDVITTRHADMQAAIFEALDTPAPAELPAGLSAAAYRSLGRDADGQLQVWPFALAVGQPLPTVPLWLGGEFAVPLDLEASYAAACADLRIRPADEPLTAAPPAV